MTSILERTLIVDISTENVYPLCLSNCRGRLLCHPCSGTHNESIFSSWVKFLHLCLVCKALHNLGPPTHSLLLPHTNLSPKPDRPQIACPPPCLSSHCFIFSKDPTSLLPSLTTRFKEKFKLHLLHKARSLAQPNNR